MSELTRIRTPTDDEPPLFLAGFVLTCDGLLGAGLLLLGADFFIVLCFEDSLQRSKLSTHGPAAVEVIQLSKGTYTWIEWRTEGMGVNGVQRLPVTVRAGIGTAVNRVPSRAQLARRSFRRRALDRCELREKNIDAAGARNCRCHAATRALGRQCVDSTCSQCVKR